MKNSQLIMFFTIAFTIYAIGNLYVFMKGYNVLSHARMNRTFYTVVFISLATTFIAGRILESIHSSVFADILNIIGGFWLGFLLYSFLFLFISDIAGLLLRISAGSHLIIDYKKWSFIVTVVLSVILITGGFINAITPRIKKYDIEIDKKAGKTDDFRIAAVSDIHLGSIIRKRSMRVLSDMLNEVRPDVIFLLGDIVDGDLGPVLQGDLLAYFNEPETKYGLYGITGNHEFIGRAERTISYIESKGIRILKDELVFLPDSIQVAGRLDRDSRRHTGKDRLPLETILKDADRSKPIIVLDHQPVALEESKDSGVDLHLSGHTHNGQMWPLNLLTRRLFELSYGHLQKGKTHVIVSSGFGLWGPRIRVGSRSEVVLVDVRFTGRESR